MLKCIFVKEIPHFRSSNPQNFPPAADISPPTGGEQLNFPPQGLEIWGGNNSNFPPRVWEYGGEIFFEILFPPHNGGEKEPLLYFSQNLIL